MAKKSDYIDDLPAAPAEGVISVPDNIQTAKDMLANGIEPEWVTRWLPQQCPGAFASAEDVKHALGL